MYIPCTWVHDFPSEKLQVIGESPAAAAWENQNFGAKLKVINPDRNKNTNHRTKEDFEKQIKKLLDLKVIRPSDSPHRSAAFMVRNHAEQVRGKARMVINYKRLNDNLVKDGYKLAGIDTLLDRIQGKKIFSKFDCKSG